jgi:uncharacterized membrane protein
VAVTIFDVLSVLVPSDETLARELYRAGTFTLIAGQAFVALAVLTGWWDRRRLRRGSEPRKVANAHGWTMLAMGAAAFGDIMIRRGVYPSAPHTPAAVLGLTVIVMALTILGGTLGGELVFDHAVGVDTDEDYSSVGQRADAPGGVSSDAADPDDTAFADHTPVTRDPHHSTDSRGRDR